MSASDSGKLTKARAAVANIRLQARTDVATQIPTLLALFSPPPEILAIDEAILNVANITTIHAGKAKVFVEGFFYDAQGYLKTTPRATRRW